MNAAQWTQVRATFDAVLDLPLHERDACLTKLAGAGTWLVFQSDQNTVSGGDILGIRPGVDTVPEHYCREVGDIIGRRDRAAVVTQGERAFLS